ncbi:hypothetical protein EK21DRAFT_84076 [Setomelanomma holmii]|uniref:Lysine-specific metallo-endopeptidase domain-containing protein n=1 Tax=Setomelanomma holmii TaxID=210430 RepID=A0A9P4HLV0_9PLEO|nr:hypothetical protein EK21DRAFT_84076 [Setomelanomma holmii]
MPYTFGAALQAILVFIIGSTAVPANSQDKKDMFQWQIYKACPQVHKDAVYGAWEDSRRYAGALQSWVPHSDYQESMDMYMGERSTYKDFSGYNFKKQIQDTARRSRELYDGVSEYGHAYLWIYCNEDSFWFSVAKRQAHWYTNNNPASQSATFFHETMHMSQLVTSPRAGDKARGGQAVYELARSGNTDYAVYNADSWQVTATAIIAQKAFNLEHPPYPVYYPPPGVTIDASNVPKEEEPETVVAELGPGLFPQGAGPREKHKPFHVDLDIWEIYNPPKKIGSQPPCPLEGSC